MEIFKRLEPFIRPYKRTIIFTLFLGVLFSLASPLSLKLLQMIFDEVFTKKDKHLLVVLPLLSIALYVYSGVMRFFHLYLLKYTSEKIGFDLRNALQAKFASLSLTFHGENTSGSLISKTTNDVIYIQLGLGILADVVKEPISVLSILGYLFYSNWRLMCLAILAAPLLITTSKSLGRSVRKYSALQAKMFEDFTNVLKETLDGIRIVKAFGLEDHMQRRFEDTTKNIVDVRRHIIRREELAGPIFELLGAVTVAGIIYVAGNEIIQGKGTSGGVVSFVVGLVALQAPIKKLQDAYVRFQNTVISTKRVFEVLDTPVEIQDPEMTGQVSVPWPENWQSIKFENVRFSYGPKNILEGLDLEIKRGEVVAIVGSSGAGKTTMVNLLPRFFDVTGGSLKIGGIDIREMSLKDLRANIGLVTQDVFLFNETIRENVLGAQRNFDREKVEHAILSANASQFVESFPNRLETIVGERGSKLSGGERQRISIARALFKDAPILILDEATSSLDSHSEKVVQAALDELMKGRTTFVIAHRLSTIQKAHRIIVLSEGKIVEEGSHEDLLNHRGLYHRLHSTQFGTLLGVIN